MNELFAQMQKYQVLGPKEGKFRGFQTLNYCARLVESYTIEEVEAYHIGFSRLLKWLQAVIALRKQDIIRRKALAKRAHENREAKIALKAKRQADRETFLKEA